MNIEHTQPTDHSPQASPTAERRALLAGIGGLAAGALLVGAKTAHAGPLTPPPGPVTSTPGPEPRTAINSTNTPGTATATFRIAQPGSYYLTANLAGETGKHGIEIAASGVTIDLNGFTISNTGLDAIAASGANTSIKIHGGHIRSSLRAGIALASQTTVIVQNVTVSECRSTGIALGPASIVESCIVDRCVTAQAGSGIIAGNEALVSNCTVRSCGAASLSAQVSGITVGGRSRVQASVVTQNRSATLATGINVGFDSTVDACTITENTGPAANTSGLILNVGASVLRSNFFGHSLSILAAGGQTSIISNTINGNGATSVGIRGASAATVHVESNRLESLGTAIDLATAAGVVIRNIFRSVTTTTTGAAVGSAIAPVVNTASIATATNPFANVQY